MRILSEIWIQHFSKFHSNIVNFNSEQEKLKQKFKNEETDIVTKFELLDNPIYWKRSKWGFEKLKKQQMSSRRQNKKWNDKILYCTYIFKSLVYVFSIFFWKRVFILIRGAEALLLLFLNLAQKRIPEITEAYV